MSEQEKLRRDIDGLKDSIRLNWADLAHRNLTLQERQDIRQHTNWLIDELKAHIERLEKLDA
jgi:hypothetical protein